jgi:DNA-directed RNA polymerase specialized sigma24 family protein
VNLTEQYQLPAWDDVAASEGDLYGDIAAGLRRGSPRAVAWLIDELGDGLHDYLSIMLGDRDVATHALADTIIVALGHLGRLTEPQLPAWLFSLARIERRRRQRIASARALPDVLGVLTAMAELDGGHEIATWPELAYLAMARMEPWDREILALGAMTPVLGTADIARVLGVGETVAADRHRHAVSRLREEAALLGFAPDVTAAELMREMSGYLLGRVPRERVLYMCVSPDLAARRRRIQHRAGPFGPDGFPVTDLYVPETVRATSHRGSPRPIRLVPPRREHLRH